MKQHSKLLACLMVGVLVLGISAAAAFGSVNGYSRYKEGVKTLALNTKNVTLNGSLEVSVDGAPQGRVKVQALKDQNDQAVRILGSVAGKPIQDQYDVLKDGKGITMKLDPVTGKVLDQSEYTSEDMGSSYAQSLLGIDPEDEMSTRMIRFAEIAADTVVGDLKNNFVEVGKKDGSTLYQVEVAKEQVPSLINAGLSVLAYGMSDSQTYEVVYQDRQAWEWTSFEKKTGEAVPELVKAYYSGEGRTFTEEEANQVMEWESRCYEAISGLEDAFYHTLNENNGGVVCVRRDGSTQYYKTYQDYMESKDYHMDHASDLDMRYLTTYMGQDMSLKTLSCLVGIDDQGRLTSNEITCDFVGVDQKGEAHTLTLTGELTAADYGTTKVPAVGQDHSHK